MRSAFKNHDVSNCKRDSFTRKQSQQHTVTHHFPLAGPKTLMHKVGCFPGRISEIIVSIMWSR